MVASERRRPDQQKVRRPQTSTSCGQCFRPSLSRQTTRWTSVRNFVLAWKRKLLGRQHLSEESIFVCREHSWHKFCLQKRASFSVLYCHARHNKTTFIQKLEAGQNIGFLLSPPFLPEQCTQENTHKKAHHLPACRGWRRTRL